MRIPPLEVLIGTACIAGAAGYTILCYLFKMSDICCRDDVGIIVSASLLFVLLPLLMLGSSLARIGVTIVAGSGLALALHHGGITLHDGALHSAMAKAVAVLLMGTAALWHSPANIWFRRGQRLTC